MERGAELYNFTTVDKEQAAEDLNEKLFYDILQRVVTGLTKNLVLQ